MVVTTRPRAALYLRVSSDEQHLDSQRADILRLCKARGYEIAHVYEEVASAASKERREYDRMRLDAHRGTGGWSVLVVAALDRLGRSMVGNLAAVLDLDRCGVEVVSVREPWLDLGGPVRPLLIAVFGWIAEQERLTIIARTRAGMARAKREGKVIGRPPAKIDMSAALRLREEGLSVRQLGKRLGVGASTVHRALQLHDALHGGRVPQGGGPEVTGDPPDSSAIVGVAAA